MFILASKMLGAQLGKLHMPGLEIGFEGPVGLHFQAGHPNTSRLHSICYGSRFIMFCIMSRT